MQISSVAGADDTGMALIGLTMRSPAISADGKHVAIYSQAGAEEKDAKTSLGVFDPSGKLEQRIGVVPPAVDAARAKDAVARITKLLDDGGYRRMGRVARAGESGSWKAGATHDVQLKSDDLVVDLHIAGRKIELHPTRAGKPLATVTHSLAAKDGACASVAEYTLINTNAGWDPATQLFAFAILAFGDDQVACFEHDVVVKLK